MESREMVTRKKCKLRTETAKKDCPDSCRAKPKRLATRHTTDKQTDKETADSTVAASEKHRIGSHFNYHLLMAWAEG